MAALQYVPRDPELGPKRPRDGDDRDLPLAEAREARPPQRPVRLFEHDPDLLYAVEPRLARIACERTVADSIVVPRGRWAPPPQSGLGREAIGLLVLDGLLMRSLAFDGLRSPELIGAGDLLRPWESDAPASVELETEWRVLERATVALLDARCARQLCRFPGVTSALLARTVQRSRWLAFQAAVAHVRRVEPRLLMLFWHLADRWGRVTPDGIRLPLRLTHSVIASLVCMRRPTVSAALANLARTGELRRDADGTWSITGTPPALAGITRRDHQRHLVA